MPAVGCEPAKVRKDDLDVFREDAEKLGVNVIDTISVYRRLGEAASERRKRAVLRSIREGRPVRPYRRGGTVPAPAAG